MFSVAKTLWSVCAAPCNCKEKALYQISFGLDWIGLDWIGFLDDLITECGATGYEMLKWMAQDRATWKDTLK